MTSDADRRTRWGTLLALRIERHSAVPIFRQIYLGIRDAIMTGRLSSGRQLPATRDLAGRLEVSRTSVLSANEQLRAEGCIDGKRVTVRVCDIFDFRDGKVASKRAYTKRMTPQ